MEEPKECHCSQPVVQRYDLVRQCPACATALIVPKDRFDPVCKDHVPTTGPAFDCPSCGRHLSAVLITAD